MNSCESIIQDLKRENFVLRQKITDLQHELEKMASRLKYMTLTVNNTVSAVNIDKGVMPCLKEEFVKALKAQETECIKKLANMNAAQRVEFLKDFVSKLIFGGASSFQRLAYYDLYLQAQEMLKHEPPSAPNTPPPGMEQPDTASRSSAFIEMEKIINQAPPETARSKLRVSQELTKLMGPQWRIVPSNDTGWRIALDKSSGKDYWWHVHTKKTQWNYPDEIKALVENAPKSSSKSRKRKL